VSLPVKLDKVERLLKQAQDLLAEATVDAGDTLLCRRIEEVHDCVADGREILQSTRILI